VLRILSLKHVLTCGNFLSSLKHKDFLRHKYIQFRCHGP
jgi:hypothetical protein